jgi:fatty-acyl-CoA synthase
MHLQQIGILVDTLSVFCFFFVKIIIIVSFQKVSQIGNLVFGIEMKIIDGKGVELPWDDRSVGDQMVRGSWVLRSYFRDEGGSPLVEGWFPTGDVAKIDADGYMQITDRSKDIIKSGGEWISSIDLENAAVGHPGVQEAAVIGVAHSKWQERPLLIVIKKPNQEVSAQELLTFLSERVARWWLPDDVVFVDELPHTATGKLLKTKLRERFKDFKLSTDPA